MWYLDKPINSNFFLELPIQQNENLPNDFHKILAQPLIPLRIGRPPCPCIIIKFFQLMEQLLIGLAFERISPKYSSKIKKKFVARMCARVSIWLIMGSSRLTLPNFPLIFPGGMGCAAAAVKLSPGGGAGGEGRCDARTPASPGSPASPRARGCRPIKCAQRVPDSPFRLFLHPVVI